MRDRDADGVRWADLGPSRFGGVVGAPWLAGGRTAAGFAVSGSATLGIVLMGRFFRAVPTFGSGTLGLLTGFRFLRMTFNRLSLVDRVPFEPSFVRKVIRNRSRVGEYRKSDQCQQSKH